MKNYITTLALIGALAPGLAMAATASGTGTASAKIVEPVTVTQTQGLNFGTVTNEAGTVSISLSGGERSSTGDNLVTDGNTPSLGQINITGPAGQPISINIPTNAEISASGAGLTVNLSSTDRGSKTLDSEGSFTIYVGGSMNPEGWTAGTYTGSYPITINY